MEFKSSKWNNQKKKIAPTTIKDDVFDPIKCSIFIVTALIATYWNSCSKLQWVSNIFFARLTINPYFQFNCFSTISLRWIRVAVPFHSLELVFGCFFLHFGFPEILTKLLPIKCCCGFLLVVLFMSRRNRISMQFQNRLLLVTFDIMIFHEEK